MQHPDQFIMDAQLSSISQKIRTLQKIEDCDPKILSITVCGKETGCETIALVHAKDIPIEFKIFIHNYKNQLITERNQLS